MQQFINEIDEKTKKKKLEKKKNILNLISPIYIAILSVCMGILMTLYPPQIYERIMWEKDYMFMDIKLYLFLVLCLISFLMGIKWAKKILKFNIPDMKNKFISKKHFILEVYILLISIIISSYYIFFVMITNRNLISTLIQGRGSEYRDSMNTVFEVNGTQAGTFLVITMTLIIWLYYYYNERKYDLNTLNKKLYSRGIKITIILFFLACVLAQARYVLMPYIVAIMYVKIYFKVTRNNISRKKIILYLIISFSFLVILFNFISYIRAGNGQVKDSNNFILGYTVACYNRLSSILSGDLKLPNSGSGFYTLRSFWYPPLIGRYYDIYNIGRGLGLNLPIPTNYDNQLLQNLIMAGLQPSFVWGTVFGFVYSDLGWFSFIYFFLYGLMSWIIYISFLKKKTIGIVLHPIIIFSILFWCGDNYIILPDFFVVIVICAFIWVAEKVIG